MQHLTYSTDLFAIPSFICKWVKNSELHQAPISLTLRHTTCYDVYFLSSPLFSSQSQSKDTAAVYVDVFGVLTK